MSFIDKVKQWMGIGGVKLQLEVPAEVAKNAGRIAGKVHVTAKSNQHVQRLNVKLVESWSTGRGEEKQTKEFDLGETVLENPFDIQAGESRAIEFHLPFKLVRSENDVLKEKGGVVGGLGKLGSMMDAEKSVYRVIVDADVKGTAFGPNALQQIKLN